MGSLKGIISKGTRGLDRQGGWPFIKLSVLRALLLVWCVLIDSLKFGLISLTTSKTTEEYLLKI